MTIGRPYWIGLILPLLLLQNTAATTARQKPQKLKMSFVKLKPGQFMMGCSKKDVQCADDEQPPHKVRLTKAFEIGRYEVSQNEWLDVMGNKPSQFATLDGWAELPVDSISWTDVQDFMQKLNDRHDGYHYRLPTEAEWEYAARGGNDGPHGVPGDVAAWYRDNAGRSHPVGKKMPNFFGLYDTEGNVWEWVQDWYDPAYYQSAPPDDPTGPAQGAGRVIRGGSFGSMERETRTSARSSLPPAMKNQGTGFRVAREVAANGQQ